MMQASRTKDLRELGGRSDDDFATEPACEAAPGATSAATPIFDADKLDELKAVMDETKFTALVGQFAESLQVRVEHLQALLATSNWPDGARAAHDIVSVAGNVGAARLSALARQIEQLCKASNETGCRSLTAMFTTEAAEAFRALKTYQAAA
jgi:HPt (histidine-containing phosphotransfer) domain-containing protein